MQGLRVDPKDVVPIWRQIEEGVRGLVSTGRLAPGAPVLSVRDLAQRLVVNPATVAKAYQRLVEAGVLAVQRGEGTFVSRTPPQLRRSERRRLLREAAQRYVTAAASVGASADEAVEELRSVLSRGASREAAGGQE